jgi:hypothetical protein
MSLLTTYKMLNTLLNSTTEACSGQGKGAHLQLEFVIRGRVLFYLRLWKIRRSL